MLSYGDRQKRSRQVVACTESRCGARCCPGPVGLRCIPLVAEVGADFRRIERKPEGRSICDQVVSDIIEFICRARCTETGSALPVANCVRTKTEVAAVLR